MSPRSARLAFLVVSPLVFLAALLVARRVVETPGDPTLYWDDDLRRETQAIVERRYVDAIDEAEARRLFNAALEGYVGRLDPFSRFVPPEDKTRVDQETQGVFGGIGIRAVPVPGGLRVTAVRESAPADAAGLEPGDVIERVDGEPLAGRDVSQMLALIQGDAGTTVAIGLRRAGAASTVSIERATVPVDTVRSVRRIPGEPEIGYVRVEQFADTTPSEVRDALARLRDEGVRGIVLDLRQNLGGVVSAAVRVASLVLPDGDTVCVVRRREGGEVHVAHRWEGFEPLDLPLAVLVDDSTASASEILAGALQDHGRAVLVGERTWGKFLMQTLVETRGGAVVRLTTARYETPRGRSAPRDRDDGPAGGLVPDVRVPSRSTAERQALLRSFDRQPGPHWHTLPSEEPEPRDPALDAALALLRGGEPPAEPVASRAL